MMANWIINALLPGGWFYTGYAWSRALRPRAHAAVVPVEVQRLSPAYQMLDDDLSRTVLRAKLAGPGCTSWQNSTMRVDGAVVILSMTCSSDQFAPAPEKDARR